MSELKRYDYEVVFNRFAGQDQMNLVEDEEGSLVKYSDVEKLLNTRTQSQCKRIEQLESALHKLNIASCKCLTKTHEYQYHAEYCPTRTIGEALYGAPPKVGE